MSELARFQIWMATQLRQRRALPADPSSSEQARAFASGNAFLSPVEQIEIYREQFWLRHTGSLVEDFPGLGGVLGQLDWERLTEDYLERHAPNDYSLRNLGDRLAQFIETDATWLDHQELCVDMARLEWAYVELFDTSDVAPLAADKLMAIPPEAWETARIVFNPALRLLHVRYPVAELRSLLRAGTAEHVPIPARQPQNLVLYRNVERSLGFRVVSAAEYALLAELRGGTPLVPACEKIAHERPELLPELEAQVGAWFRAWGERGWVVDVDVGAK